MGIFSNVAATALSSGSVTKNNDTTWNRKINDNGRADKRKELQKKALNSYAKAILDFDSLVPEGNSKQFIG